jgi:hypothetical protein
VPRHVVHHGAVNTTNVGSALATAASKPAASSVGTVLSIM